MHEIARRHIRERGFTLTELLCVIGTLSLLLAMLAPALLSSRRRANSLTCLNNLRQIGAEALAYDESYRGYGSPGFLPVQRCPSEDVHPISSYGMNWDLWNVRLCRVSQPSRIVLFVEMRLDGWITPSTVLENFSRTVDVTRHLSEANYLFCDGHAEPITWRKIQETFTKTHNFIDPQSTW